MSSIQSVSQVTQSIRQALEKALPYVWVRGEISNLHRAASRHLYFSLQEGDAQLKCVWFSHSQNSAEGFDPLTGEVFEHTGQKLVESLQNGHSVIVSGQLTVYPPQGVYQLKVERLMSEGEGAYHLAFQESVQKLAHLGYFDPAKKRPLPSNPSRVFVITSAQGAAIHDFIKIAEQRGLGSEIVIIPSLVQGDDAPRQLCAALKRAYAAHWADCIVLIRGGGSLQDLVAFNDVELAKLIAASPVPVITGIGHEPDVSIADMVADVRAATPSHTAQLLWPERKHLSLQVAKITGHLQEAIQRIIRGHCQHFEQAQRALLWHSPLTRIKLFSDKHQDLYSRLLRLGPALTRQKQELCIRLEERLNRALLNKFNYSQQRLDLLHTRLQALSPLAPLDRGYSLTQDEEGRLVRSVKDIRPEAKISILLKDGEIAAKVNTIQVNKEKT